MNRNEIIGQYYQKIFKLCIYNLKNTEESEDLTQEIFFKIFNKLDTFQEQAKLYTWIYRIAINTIINHVKRKKIIRFLTFESNGCSEFEISSDGLDDPAERSEQKEERRLKLLAIQQAKQVLSDKERIAFFLFCYEGHKQKRIAEMMNCSVSAVESLIFKAKKKIKKEIARLYPDICHNLRRK